MKIAQIWTHLQPKIFIKKASKSHPNNLKIHLTNITKNIENSSKIYQNLSKINQKSSKTSSWAPRGSRISSRPSQARKREENLILPGHHFGRFLKPCWLQEASQGYSKSIQNFHRFGSPSFIEFSSILTGFWEDLGPKLASKIH